MRKIINVTLMTDFYLGDGMDDVVVNRGIRKDLEAAISLCGKRYEIQGMTVLNQTTCVDCRNTECEQWSDESGEICKDVIYAPGFVTGWTDIQTKYVKEKNQNGKV